MLNSLHIIGNLADNAVIRTTQSGLRFATFRLITSENVFNKTTLTWDTEKTGFPVVVWGRRARYAERTALKGQLFFVEAKMRNRRFEKDGAIQFAWEAVVSDHFGDIRCLVRPTEGPGHSDNTDMFRHDGDDALIE